MANDLTSSPLSRRAFVGAAGLTAAALAAYPAEAQSPRRGDAPKDTAADEPFWSGVARQFQVTTAITNLDEDAVTHALVVPALRLLEPVAGHCLDRIG